MFIDLSQLDKNVRIEAVETCVMMGVRPRTAGSNARLPEHGKETAMRMARIRAGGMFGYGFSEISREQAKNLIGKTLGELFDRECFLEPEYHCAEFPLLDLIGRMTKRSVSSLVAANGAAENALSVPCYDTTLYFDDLHLASDADAAALMREETEFGLSNGHRHFKVKVGRCGMHMSLDEGINRDVAIVHAVRAAAGADALLMVDANNGFNLNLTKLFLERTADDRLYWLEEAFHEDDRLYKNLKDWMKERKIETLIADGEGYAAPPIVEWAEKGLVDVIQYDLRGYGFFNWLRLGKRLAAAGVKGAPHNYGGVYGNYASAHIFSALPCMDFVEWDDATVEGMDASAYAIREGRVHMADAPGFGLEFDSGCFERLCGESGFKVE